MNTSIDYHTFTLLHNREIRIWAIKFSISFAFIFSLMATAQSQDVLFKLSGDEIKAKVNEIGEDVIKYQKFENLDGPVYTIKKSEVFMIRFANGSKEVFSSSPTVPANPAIVQVPVGNNFQKKSRLEGEGFKYFQDGRSLPLNRLEGVFMETGNKDYEKRFKSVKTMHAVAKILTIVGPILLGGGVIMIAVGANNLQEANDYYTSSYNRSYSSSQYNADVQNFTGLIAGGITMATFGTGSMVTGFVLRGVGKYKLKMLVEKYNASIN
ncbi:MAG: hypothetical protein K2Q22_06975 [Cytophagales bacterium]|nr:hypothetical protein [Cytophagales bacterium]